MVPRLRHQGGAPVTKEYQRVNFWRVDFQRMAIQRVDFRGLELQRVEFKGMVIQRMDFQPMDSQGSGSALGHLRVMILILILRQCQLPRLTR